MPASGPHAIPSGRDGRPAASVAPATLLCMGRTARAEEVAHA